MFNFNLVNKAFGDERITPTQFKMLYLIVNNCSMNDTTTIKMFNGFLADKMGLSARMMQYNVKQLEECGYISVKRPIGRNAAKQPNEITLMDCENATINDAINCALSETNKESEQLNGAMNCTPYNTRKINKNISVYTGTSTRGDKNVQGEDTMNISVQVEDNTNASGNEYEDGTFGDDVDTSIEVKDAGTTPQVKLSKDEIRKRNDYISAVYKKLDTKFDFLYSLRTYSLYVDEVGTVAKIITEAQGHRDWFTLKQWDKLTWYCERFVKITEVKDNYFNGGTKKNADADIISVDDENASANFNDSSDDSTNDNPVPAPTDWAKVGAWVVDSLERFSTYEAWEKELDRILNKKFGDGWECAEHQIMSQASAIYNRCTKTAIDHYRSLDNSEDKTPTPTDEETDLAPWETPLNYTYTSRTTQVAHESVSDVEPTNHTTDNNEAHRNDLCASGEVEPDDEDMAFDDYVALAQSSRTATEYGYRYAV